MRSRIAPALLAFSALGFVGCESADSAGMSTQAESARAVPELPCSGCAAGPWGGPDAAHWRPEAILANRASQMLNEAWRTPDLADARVSIPVRMLDSDLFPYGDGQSNAAPSFESWHGASPPLSAMLMTMRGGSSRVSFMVDPEFTSGSDALDLEVGDVHAQVALERAADGSLRGEWPVPSGMSLDRLGAEVPMIVRSAGADDGLVVLFRMAIRNASDLVASLPSEDATFKDGGSILDHEGVAKRAPNAANPYDRLTARVGSFSSAYNQNPFLVDNVHASFPHDRQTFATAVGRGWTWVANPPAAPLKVLYTCFERRRPDLESSAPTGGVPTGGGFHKIGDPAETIFNDLEDAPIPVGFATRNPMPVLGRGTFAYGLSDAVVVRMLMPGEAFVTRAGGALPASDGNTYDVSNYHWFIFPASREVCTEEWVHPCAPDDAYGFACGKANVRFELKGAPSGGTYAVVGDAPELGAWQPDRGLALTPRADGTWIGDAKIAQGQALTFKFVRTDGGAVTWEGASNRDYTSPRELGGVYVAQWGR